MPRADECVTFEEWWDECIGAGPDPDNDPNPLWTHGELKETCEAAFEAGENAARLKGKAG